MTKIAIIGPGAIGGTMAAWLAQVPGREIALCVRTAVTELQVDTPQGRLTVRPRVITDPADAHPVDWILAATKTYDSAAIAPWVKGLLGPNTALAALQNGVEHVSRFAPFVTDSRILPVVVECPAERIAPGKIRQRGPAWMKIPDTSLGRTFQALFSGTPIDVQCVADFATAAWSKLCLNCAGAVSAITLKPAGVARDIPEIAELMRGLVRECIAVGNAEGAKLPNSLADTVLENYLKAPLDSINSLHADRLADRPMEIDARNGVIVRLGAKHGIPTPINQAVVALLLAVQASKSAAAHPKSKQPGLMQKL